MKYGIISAAPSKGFINIGDDFQSYAIRNLLHEMGISSSDIVTINSSELKSYVGEYVILPINYYVESHSDYEVFPLSPYIIPVFIGLHYRIDSEIKPNVLDYFKQYQPIGCRDEYTLNILRNNGVQAYLFGCMTATLPSIKVERTPNKILCVDAPEAIFPHIPKELTDRYEIEITSHIVYGDDFSTNNRTSILYDYIAKYRDEAALIITSRLHCAAPCLAMGIPLIAAFENRSERLAWLDKLVPLYIESEFETIDWNVTSIDFEDLKYKMKEIAKKRITETKEKYDNITDISYYWENRKKSEYGNAIKDILLKNIIAEPDGFDYIIWGTGAVGKSVYNTVCELYPNSNLLCAIDTYAKGDFFGRPIHNPEARYNYQDTIIFVASYSGRNEIESQLITDGKTRGKDYILFSLTTG